MKQITIIGNLGANAVRRMTSDGKELLSFNVAVNAGQDKVIWFSCVGNMREKLIDYLVKGQCVCVTGDLRPGVYNGLLDLSVSIDKIELCGSAPKREEQPQDQPGTHPYVGPSVAPTTFDNPPADQYLL